MVPEARRYSRRDATDLGFQEQVVPLTTQTRLTFDVALPRWSHRGPDPRSSPEISWVCAILGERGWWIPPREITSKEATGHRVKVSKPLRKEEDRRTHCHAGINGGADHFFFTENGTDPITFTPVRI